MKNLNPTLWRTCRTLAGTVRIRLLRLVLENPAAGVSRLAKAAGIGQSDASQELRRLQSRGLLKRVRAGRLVLFRPVPDPQVSSATPLLKSLKTALANQPSQEDETLIRLAMGLAHETRIKIARELQNGPRRSAPLARTLRLAPNTLHRHLQRLKAGGWVHQESGWLLFDPPRHPVARTLTKLL